MTRLDWALLLLTPLGWGTLCVLLSILDNLTRPEGRLGDKEINLIGLVLTLACWGVYLGWGRP